MSIFSMGKNILTAFFDSKPASYKEEENTKKIIDLLNKYSCNVIQTVMATDWALSVSQGKKAAENIYLQKIKDIKDADIMICEMSNASSTLTFEVFESLNMKKPTLILYDEKDYLPDLAFQGNPSKLLMIEIYNENNLEEKIKNFLKRAASKKPLTRFTLRLSKQMGDYLNYLKARMKLSSKNDVVSEILLEKMNEDYDFLKNYR